MDSIEKVFESIELLVDDAFDRGFAEGSQNGAYDGYYDGYHEGYADAERELYAEYPDFWPLHNELGHVGSLEMCKLQPCNIDWQQRTCFV